MRVKMKSNNSFFRIGDALMGTAMVVIQFTRGYGVTHPC